MKTYINLFVLLLIIILLGCTAKQNNESTENLSNTNKYAKGFAIIPYDTYQEVLVFNPWKKNTVYARYFLVDSIETETPANGKKIIVPLQSLVPASVTHFEFISLLGELASIQGVCSPELIYHPEIKRRYEIGEIANLGDAFNINIEKSIQLHPLAIMMSGYNQNDPYIKRAEQAGLTIILNNEWMENSLLARAEWIKFVAAFYNKASLADSIFDQVEQNYLRAKALAANAQKRPAVMSGSNFRGTWYMPSGKNFMSQLFVDAGGNYLYSNDTTTNGSLPLTIESVLRDFSTADIWLNCNFQSIDALIQADAKHKLFKPVNTGAVYNFNKRMLESSANDFWESAIARPDLLLMDVISVLHPQLTPHYETVYLQKLN